MPQTATRPQGTRLLYLARVRRSDQLSALLRALLLASTAFAAYVALLTARDRQLIDPVWMDIGLLTAILLGTLSCLRFITHLILLPGRRNQLICLYDQGFTWRQGRDEKRYPWNQVVRYQENLRGPAALSYGNLKLQTVDERAYQLTAVHGNLRRIARLIRPYIAEATAQQMQATLQRDRPVRLHRKLLVWPNGVSLQGREITWPELELRIRRGRLQFHQRKTNGKTRAVKALPLRTIGNLAGFLQLTQSAQRASADQL